MFWLTWIESIIDILITALFLYSIFLFLRRTRSYMVLLGLAIVLVLYIFARAFHLQLTLLALQYFVGASVVIFAIVFQTELRKFLEMLGLISSRQIRVRALANKSPSVAEIVQSCVQMAQDKIGALVVIQGRDALETFIEGGIALDGVISEEVILSLFDPTSEGHDGALIINNNRISKFGTHLPMSTNFNEIGKHGTRHSAALGLTENSDALSIVVSEEKGKISVCKDGKLKTLNDYSDLETEINKYIQTKFGRRTENIIEHIVHHNIKLKIVALGFAIVVWILYTY
ncbi:MAG TPA: diadenylate cyclase [Candidatus Saccharimonadales bacterium]|nr:diadenylate cyclase [Candidatus Saccharimonadales bacterium]